MKLLSIPKTKRCHKKKKYWTTVSHNLFTLFFAFKKKTTPKNTRIKKTIETSAVNPETTPHRLLQWNRWRRGVGGPWLSETLQANGELFRKTHEENEKAGKIVWQLKNRILTQKSWLVDMRYVIVPRRVSCFSNIFEKEIGRRLFRINNFLFPNGFCWMLYINMCDLQLFSRVQSCIPSNSYPLVGQYYAKNRPFEDVVLDSLSWNLQGVFIGRTEDFPHPSPHPPPEGHQPASFTAGCCTRHSLGMAEAGVLLAAWRHLVEKMEEVMMMVMMVTVWRPWW